MSHKVQMTDLPQNSHLQNRLSATDFIDCYTTTSSLSPREAADIITTFPGWAQNLVALRRIITSPFGLKNTNAPTTSARDNRSEKADEVQENIGGFPIETETPTEIIAGFNDKHLDFRISVMSDNGKIFLATWVHTHNIGGKIYLLAIMPFHILIVRNALTRVAAAN